MVHTMLQIQLPATSYQPCKLDKMGYEEGQKKQGGDLRHARNSGHGKKVRVKTRQK